MDVGPLRIGEGVEGDELIHDDLLADEFADKQEILVRNAEKPSHRVEDITQDELKSELGCAQHAPVAGPPTQEAVD